MLNAGSSSLKYQVVDPASGRGSRARPGRADRQRRGPADPPRPSGRGERGARGRRPPGRARGRARRCSPGPGSSESGLLAVGHRVVHGGPTLTRPHVVDDEVLAEIEHVARLAPLHNPPAVAGIRSARAAFPDLPQVAVFDTAFFAALPAAAATYAARPGRWPTRAGHPAVRRARHQPRVRRRRGRRGSSGRPADGAATRSCCTSATARPPRRSGAAGRSTPRWGSPRWRGW